MVLSDASDLTVLKAAKFWYEHSEQNNRSLLDRPRFFTFRISRGLYRGDRANGPPAPEIRMTRPAWDSYRRLPSAARIVPATGSRASIGPSKIPRAIIHEARAWRATVGRGLPDAPLPVFPAGIYLQPGGPTEIQRPIEKPPGRRRIENDMPRKKQYGIVTSPRSRKAPKRDPVFCPKWIKRSILEDLEQGVDSSFRKTVITLPNRVRPGFAGILPTETPPPQSIV